MTIRNILAIMTGSDVDGSVAATAFLAAGRFGAHVAGLHVRPDVVEDLPYVDEGMSQSAIAREFEARRQRQEGAESRAREQFEAAAAEAGAGFAEAPGEGAGSTASWQVETGRTLEVVAQKARVFDLTVASSHAQAAGVSGRAIVECVVFETGRPALLAPAEVAASIGNRVFVAWNRSAQSARAVAGAMPFLAAASRVDIAYIETGAKAGPPPEELQASLAWHGVEATVKRMPPGGASVAELLAATAADSGADLVVMGAYSHSRFREMVLGGVTNDILEHTTLPVLMAH